MTKNYPNQKSFIFKILLLSLFITIVILAVGKQEIVSRFQKDTEKIETPTYTLPQIRTYENQITLPAPKTTSGMSLEKAIQQRRSRREFSQEPVTKEQLSQLLWSGQGITDSKTGHRAAPSAREAYPFTVFVLVRNVANLSPGLYEYLPKEHSLGNMNLENADEKIKSAGVQPGAQNAPVVFVLAASYGTAEKILGASAVSSSLIEAGHIGQNMYLQTESLEMAMVVMAGFDAKKVGSALQLDPAQTVVYLMPFGHRATEKKTEKEVLGETTDNTHLFTKQELAAHDGKEGRTTYFAYKGKVYDVTNSEQWKNGEHYELLAGKDLTGMLGDAPHGDEVLTKFPVVGTFAYQETPLRSQENVTTLYYLAFGVAGIAIVAVLIGMKVSKKNKK